MKRVLKLGAAVTLFLMVLVGFSWAQCPEDPGDQGECDTLNLTCYDCEVDTLAGGPYTVQFPLYVTNDLTDPIDSVASFIIPLAWTRTNPAAYCSVSDFWNNTWLYPFPDVLTKNSIYHHITDPATGDTLIRNRMMDMSETLLGTDWDTRILNLDGTSHFWLSMFPTGGQDQRWWEADRALLATMTFRVADTMHVCIDTTFWAPASRLNFIRDDGVGYIPRHNMPRCFFIGPAQPPLCDVDPTSLDFGTVTVGDSADLTFSISNIGGGTLSGTVSEACDYYSVVGDAGYSLGSGESKQFTVRFKPLAAGVSNCTIETGNETCADVSCTGTGEEAGAVHFVFKDNTGDSYSIVVDSAFLDAVEFEDGDEIGVFDDTSGAGGLLCVGASVYHPDDLPMPLVAWKDDPLTPEKDGYTAGDSMYFRVWSSNQEREEEACAHYVAGDGHFEYGFFSQLWLEAPGPCVPVCVVDPTSLDFATVTVGDSLDTTFTISNTGGGTLSSTVSEACDDYYLIGDATYSLTSGQSKDFTVRFKPLTVGVKDCTIETGHEACVDVSCTGTGEEAPPVCVVDPASLDFATVTVGDSLDTTFSISNTGGGTLTGTVSETCDDYMLVGDVTYSLTSGQSKDFTVRFKPLSLGVKNCTLETGDDACVDVSCTGTGEEAPPVCLVDPTSLDFGTITLGDSADLTFSISNTGGGTLSGTVSENCDDYYLVGDVSYSLTSGQSKDFTIRFKPLTVGVKDCTIETGDEACVDVSCTGTGEEAPPVCLVDPTSLDFGPVTVGSSSDMIFSISNTGGGTLTGTVSETCDDYSVVGDVSYSLGSGQSKDFTVRFEPLSTGVKDCTIETGHEACVDVSCTGIGEGVVPPVCVVDPTSLDFSTVTVGDSLDTTFTISNTGGGTLTGTVSETCDDYMLVGDMTYSLTSGQSQDFTVRFKPLTVGVKDCTVETGDDACDDVSCTGTGEEGCVNPVHFVFRENTGDSYSLVIDSAFLDALELEECDEVGVFDDTGGIDGFLCVGASVYHPDDLPVPLVAWKDDPLTPEKDGYTAGDTMYFRVWSSNQDREEQACAYYVVGDGHFESGFFSQLWLEAPGPCVPICEVDPASLDFGTVTVGNSLDKTFTLTNVGGGVLSGTITACPPEFTVSPSSYSLEPNQSATITVTFTPLDCGFRSCTINNGDDCSDVTCIGTGGGPPVCEVDPTDFDFGTVIIGQSSQKTYTVTNTGCETLSGTIAACAPEFTVSPSSYSLGPDESTTITVTFVPQQCGPRGCTVNNGDDCSDVVCSGIGDGPPVCAVSLDSLKFGTVTVGDSLDRTFAITNSGCGTLSGSINGCAPEFTVSPGSYGLGPDESVTVTVRFKPTSAGDFECAVEIGDDACTDVTCTGTGTEGGAICEVDPTNLDFGTLMLGDHSDLTFTISNIGGGVLSGEVSETCPYYQVLGDPGCNLTGGQSKTFTVRFTPSFEGVENCTIETGNGACDDVSCTGAAQSPPTCQVHPASLDFGEVRVGDSLDVTFSICNPCAGLLIGTVSEECDDYSLIGDVDYSLPDGQCKAFKVRFKPTSPGVQTCTIETGSGICVDVSCTGTGEEIIGDFIISIDPPSQHTLAGQIAGYVIDLTPLSGFNQPCTLLVSGLPDPPNMAVFEPPTLIPPGSVTLYVHTTSETDTGTYVLTVTVQCLAGEKPGAPEHSTQVVLSVHKSTDVGDWADSPNAPKGFVLFQNRPNPFNGQTQISYVLLQDRHVRLSIYSVLGKRIRSLVDEYQTAGYHQVGWDAKDDDGRDVASGTYFYNMKVGESGSAMKMTYIR